MKFLTLFSLTFSLVSAFDAGAVAALDFSIFTQAKDVYFSYIMEAINDSKIPDISFKGGYLNGNTFHATEPSEGVVISANDDNSVTLASNNLQASFHSNAFKYKWSFIEAKGSVDVSFSQMTVNVKLGMITQTLPNGKVVPAVSVVSSSVDLPKSGIKIKIHGDIVAKIAD